MYLFNETYKPVFDCKVAMLSLISLYVTAALIFAAKVLLTLFQEIVKKQAKRFYFIKEAKFKFWFSQLPRFLIYFI